MNSADLLAAVRRAQGLPSNYALARFLDVRENSVHRWHSCRHTPDDAMAARLAELAGLDPDSVVAAMHAQRAAAPEERARWLRIAARLAGSHAVAAAALLLVVLGGPDAMARPGALDQGLPGVSVYYVYLLAVLVCAASCTPGRWSFSLARR